MTFEITSKTKKTSQKHGKFFYSFSDGIKGGSTERPM